MTWLFFLYDIQACKIVILATFILLSMLYFKSKFIVVIIFVTRNVAAFVAEDIVLVCTLVKSKIFSKIIIGLVRFSFDFFIKILNQTNFFGLIDFETNLNDDCMQTKPGCAVLFGFCLNGFDSVYKCPSFTTWNTMLHRYGYEYRIEYETNTAIRQISKI